MACVLTQFVTDVKLSSPPSFHSSSSPCAARSAPHHDDDHHHHHHPHSSTMTPSHPTTTSSSSSSSPSSLHRHSSHHSHHSSSDSDSQPSSPHSPSTSSHPPSSSTPSAGNSCHQCKTAKDSSLLLFCSSAAEKGVRKRRCRKKYCESCLRRSYNPEVGVGGEGWVCPSCQGFCVCAACSRGGEGELSKEKISGGLQALAAMSPVVLALLGIDERKLNQLQAVVNSPAMGGDGAGLLAMMSAMGVGSMQEMNLQAESYQPPSLMMGGGYEEGMVGQGYEAAGSVASTVSSPYASSGYASSQSSPLLRSVMGQTMPSPGMPPPPVPSEPPPTYSPRLVSRAHTHGGIHASIPTHPRLLSHPPPHPHSHLTQSMPAPSRHLPHLDALESSYHHQLTTNRKRSWSNSLGEEPDATAGRPRFPYDESVKVEGWGVEMEVQRRLVEAQAEYRPVVEEVQAYHAPVPVQPIHVGQFEAMAYGGYSRPQSPVVAQCVSHPFSL